jgi:uncharacterized membrane protein (DUF4010 family)
MIAIDQMEGAMRLAIAALIGLGVGLEREWSGHTSGPDARFAGIRTFLLLGMLGGGAGLLFALDQPAGGSVLAAAGALFCVTAYFNAARRAGASMDGTTEVAALVVLLLGIIAGIGWLALAAGAGAIVVMALSEKTRMHQFVSRVEEHELRAALQFAVLALVILPLLPTGPFLGELAIRPRLLWMLVLIFSGLNFAGYVARRAVGPERGYGIAGAIGGLISSTAVTITFSRQSVLEPSLTASLSRGVVAAGLVMTVRVGILTAALAADVALPLIPLLLPAVLAAGAVLYLVDRNGNHDSGLRYGPALGNPLRLMSAIKMAALSQAGMIAITLVARLAGETGLYVTGALIGITDVDALIVSMTQSAAELSPQVAARVICVGVIAVTVFKAVLSIVLGNPEYRRVVVPPLLLMAAACGGALIIL